MGRVGEVPGEAARRPLVALLAGVGHVLAAQARWGSLINRDVVRAVAVVAFRGLGGLELGDLAVVGVPVRLAISSWAAAPWS